MVHFLSLNFNNRIICCSLEEKSEMNINHCMMLSSSSYLGCFLEYCMSLLDLCSTTEINLIVLVAQIQSFESIV